MARAIVDGLGQGLHGDKTTTGATCIGNFPWSTQDGRDVLRVGDSTTPCPKCGEAGTILEGSPAIHWHGRATALHGALIQCACPLGQNRLIAWPEPEQVREMPPIPLPFSASPSPTAPSAASRPGNAPTATRPVSADEDNEVAEPGFYIVPRSTTRQQLIAELFGEAPSPEVMRKFNGLNGSLGEDIVKAGQMVVLGDPRNYMCMREEAHLMEAAEEVAVALADLTPEDADFMNKYHGEIASFLGSTSTWAGVTMTVMEKHLEKLTEKMMEGVSIHQNAFARDKHFKGAEFTTAREKWISELDSQLLNSRRIRSLTTLGDHPKLKKALGISTKSLAYHWKKAGGIGDIPGYSKHIEAMAKATRYMKNGGYLAIGLGFTSSLTAIQEICTNGSAEECKMISLSEGGKFIGSASLGYAAGIIAGHVAPKLCLVLGFNGVGKSLCTGFSIGAGTWGGTEFGGWSGEKAGTLIYEGDFI